MDFTFFAQYQGFEFHCSPVRMPGGGFMPRLVVSADFGATRVDIPVSAPWARTAPPFSPMPAGEACIVVRTWTRLDASNLSGGSDVGALSSHRLATGERPNPTLTSARDSAGATDRATPAMPRFAQNNVGRDFAVGDIHGCFTVLHRGLDAIGFDPTADRLFSVGDLVDRGPESHLALRWLAKPWFHAICGNHDFMAWRHAIGQPYEEVDHLQHGGAWLLMLSDAQRQEFGARLAALPLVLEVETGQGVVGLVHADCPYDDWLEMVRVPWHDTKAVSAIADCCLWSFERYSRRYKGYVKNVRAVAHGHMTTRTMEVLGNVHFIDTGGWRPGGHFTFLDLQTLVARQGPVNGTPVLSRRNR